MLASGATISAVIDWEIWSIGDPRVDLGWFLLNADPSTYGRNTRYAKTVPSLEELSATYISRFGREVRDIEWFRALACFKSAATWGLILKHNARIGDVARSLPALLQRAGELTA